MKIWPWPLTYRLFEGLVVVGPVPQHEVILLFIGVLGLVGELDGIIHHLQDDGAHGDRGVLLVTEITAQCVHSQLGRHQPFLLGLTVKPHKQIHVWFKHKIKSSIIYIWEAYLRVKTYNRYGLSTVMEAVTYIFLGGRE